MHPGSMGCAARQQVRGDFGAAGQGLHHVNDDKPHCSRHLQQTRVGVRLPQLVGARAEARVRPQISDAQPPLLSQRQVPNLPPRLLPSMFTCGHSARNIVTSAMTRLAPELAACIWAASSLCLGAASSLYLGVLLHASGTSTAGEAPLLTRRMCVCFCVRIRARARARVRVRVRVRVHLCAGS